MKPFRALPSLLFTSFIAFAGCQQYSKYIDTTPSPVGDHTITGTVVIPPGINLPPDAIVTVWLVDRSQNDLRFAGQTIRQPPAGKPIPFQIDYKAEEIRPPHNVRLDALIEYSGRLRLMSSSIGRVNNVTPENADTPFTLKLAELSGTAAPAASGPLSSYTVKEGDTAMTIARNGNITMSALVAANPGLDWTTLKTGQKINLPAAP